MTFCQKNHINLKIAANLRINLIIVKFKMDKV
jgi:hypothetical protein